MRARGFRIAACLPTLLYFNPLQDRVILSCGADNNPNVAILIGSDVLNPKISGHSQLSHSLSRVPGLTHSAAVDLNIQGPLAFLLEPEFRKLQVHGIQPGYDRECVAKALAGSPSMVRTEYSAPESQPSDLSK